MSYFLGRDSSSHWYLVEADKRLLWNTWCELDEDNELAWEVPEFAQRISGNPSNIEFETYKDVTL